MRLTISALMSCSKIDRNFLKPSDIKVPVGSVPVR